MSPDGSAPLVRIGELSRRTGVRAETIRAWERRYGLISPVRSDGGFRLYSAANEQRIQAMRSLIADGVAPAEAARQLQSTPAAPTSDHTPRDEAHRLQTALEAYDEEAANAVLDRTLSGFSLEAFTDGVVLPAMTMIGRRWVGGEVSVAQEHFASSVIRGRLLALARDWGSGIGPLAVLACPPGELHDLGLISFGLALRNQGWRITYLGPNTPLDTLADAVRRLDPAVVVLSSAVPECLVAAEKGLSELASMVSVWIGGPGADEQIASRSGTHLLSGHPTEAAKQLAAA